MGAVLVLLLVAVGCTSSEETPEAASGQVVSSPSAAETAASPSPTPRPVGETRTVTSADDSGPGTLREALTDAQPGDTITFNPAVFPPGDPQTISVESALPQVVEDYLTIDASEAGVILDGSLLPEGSWDPGLEVLSDHNVVRGLQVINFTGVGIAVAGGRDNTIGGDRNVGAGPVGQGNLTAGNDFGIGLWASAAGNVVTGNLVGTDQAGAAGFGNASSGVWLTDGATDNVVGPDNVIASHGMCGVQVGLADAPRSSSGTVGNTITRNSIQDSRNRGICLQGGSNTGLAAPIITDFDVASGLVTGTVCAGCSVEVFSDEGDEGATYEGQATGDGSGAFDFDKAAGFANPNVTVTATDSKGNTSPFSLPVGAITSILTLQERNRQPMSPLVAMPSSELADNRFGLSFAGAGLWEHFDSVVYELVDVGAKRVDTTTNELEPPIDWERPEYEFPPAFDRFVDELAGHGIALDFMLHFWDKDGRARGEELATPRFRSSDQVEDFLDYVRFVVRSFKGRIPYYTIWSEPDFCGDGGIKCIAPNDYVELVRQVIPVIREEDPRAQIVNAPNVLFYDYYQGGADRYANYFRTLLNSDVVSMFDVLQWHGMYNVTPDNPRKGSYYYDYPAVVEEIKEAAAARGFEGEYWSTEMSWCSSELDHFLPGCAASHAGVIETDKQAGKYYARGLIANLGMDLAVGVGGFQPDAAWSYPAVRRLNTLLAGAAPTSLDVDISVAAADVPLQTYGFELPDGDTLFAVWTDGVAVDDDPGLNAALTFPGISAGAEVSGIDVLYGFEQELITGSDGGDLVVRDLLVKDYPTILRMER